MGSKRQNINRRKQNRLKQAQVVDEKNGGDVEDHAADLSGSPGQFAINNTADAKKPPTEFDISR